MSSLQTTARRTRGISAYAFCLFAGTLLLSEAADSQTPPIGEDRIFFEKRIRPVLAEHCYDCHSEKSGKRKGGLWLDRKAGWELGGDSGPSLVPGDPEGSLLIQTIRYHDPDLEMPPEEKLPEAAITALEDWVRRGAPDPRTGKAEAPERTIDIEEGRQFWSFQPIQDPPLPPVKQKDWPRDPVDRFILASLERNELTPTIDADRATLLRRVTITLTGLPPTLEEQDAFFADESSGAFEKVVDRLLASDAFAERWGRHWLDIMRYADTSGGGRAMALPEAWRFRDYVIDSFREDKAQDEMIREMIAGDLLPFDSKADRMEKIIATGYLLLGPHNYENQDKELLELEIADEQIDTIGRSFLGMTIGCARCHDHKFDPIPTADYYSLAGILLSTRSVNHSNVSKWNTQPYNPTPEEAEAIERHERTSAPLRVRLDLVKKEIQRLGQIPGKPNSRLGSISTESLAGIARDNTAAVLKGDWQESTSNRNWVGTGYIHDLSESGVEKSVTWKIPLPVAGPYEVRISFSPGSNRASNVPVTVVSRDGEETVRINQRKKPEHEGIFQTVGTFDFDADSATIQIGNDQADGVVIADAVQLLPTSKPLETFTTNEPEKEASAADAALVASLQEEHESLSTQLKELDKEKPRLPSVMAVSEGDHPEDTPIRVRGMVRNLGEPAPRGFLQVASQAEAVPAIAPEKSGRLELAHWITSPDNPLTARVLANRIWLHLFGEGIVASTDNFGTTGRAPTHPELLDHVATRLITNDWSIKQTIRELLLTRTWQLSSEPAPGNLGNQNDPGNQLLSHSRLRKIDAEILRDTLLFLAGNLDADRGGPSLPPGFKSEFGYQFTSLKRSVYIPVFRNQPHEIFAAFDFANPNFVVGRRSSSNLPTQSLFLMNSPFVHEQARLSAESLLADTPNVRDDDARVIRAYRTTLGRSPRQEELALSLRFLREEGHTAASPHPEAWTALMRTLFSCVDFQYVR